MRNIITIIILLLTTVTYNIQAKKPPEEVWLEIKNATAFEEEFIRKDLQKKTKGIVNFKRDNNFGVDKGISYDGGIKITFVDEEDNLFIESTRKIRAYNVDLEQIEIPLIKINRATIRLFQDQNRLYAFINSITHGVTCHALTDSLTHTDWGLCRPQLSTDKVYWSKKHRRHLRRHLKVPGRTGKVLKR